MSDKEKLANHRHQFYLKHKKEISEKQKLDRKNNPEKYHQSYEKRKHITLNKNKEYLKNRRKDFRYSLFNNAKYRAKKNNLEFSITIDDIIIPELCPIFLIKLITGSSKTIPQTPSLDRINPKIGYIKSNIWVISHRANKIKNDASVEELKMVAYGLELKLKELNK